MSIEDPPNPQSPAKGFRLVRERLAESIAAADIGFAREDIITERQQDVWNAVLEAASLAHNGVSLAIGLAEGKNRDTIGADLDFDLRITVTLSVEPVTIRADETPEEELFEDLLDHCHGLEVPGEIPHCEFEFKVEGFGELGPVDDGTGNALLMRQIILTKRASLPRSS